MRRHKIHPEIKREYKSTLEPIGIKDGDNQASDLISITEQPAKPQRQYNIIRLAGDKLKIITPDKKQPSIENGIFLSGYKGYLGSAIYEDLSKDKDIVGYDSKEGNDILDYSNLVAAMRGCQCIIHGAAIPHPGLGEILDYFRVNVEGTQNVLQAAREIGVKKFIYLSSGAYYGWDTWGDFPAMIPLYLPIDESHPPVTATGRFNGKLDSYCQSKVMAEQLVAYYGSNYFQIIILRLAPASINEDHLKACVDYFNTEEGERPQGIEVHLRTFWTYVTPQMVARAVRCALDFDGKSEVFNIAEPESPINLDWDKYLKNFPNIPFKRKWEPPDPLLDLTKARELLGCYI